MLSCFSASKNWAFSRFSFLTEIKNLCFPPIPSCCFLRLLVGGSPSSLHRRRHLSESPCFLSVHVQAGTLFVSLGPNKGWWHPVWSLSELVWLCLLASWVQWSVHQGLQPVSPSVSSYLVYSVLSTALLRDLLTTILWVLDIFQKKYELTIAWCGLST